ncbi:MAG: TonB-dependent receptor [Tepidimonas sp.]|uniref:TonB-dependent receptor plug domain-containing protein n=1 Tax=Tepidimonas sp. TaxID=2002775 RepID=UPI00259DEC25|nr:TonB-dependent receptor [Tepidimonas sp.]MDM7457010.1 TonB-dependent receptor [Tepidimonas sp.]
MNRHAIALATVTASCTALAAEPQPAQLKEVTATATTDALTEQREAVAQKTVIDRKEIEALGGLTVGEVIRKLPGIEAGEHGSDGGIRARARGMRGDAVQFLVNGERPTANARFALTQVGRMPAGELERIEILRGGSAEFGGAAAVTVNLVMKQPVARALTSLKLAAGQRGSAANAQVTLTRGGGAGGFSWLLPVSLNRHGRPLEQTLKRFSSLDGAQRETERGEDQEFSGALRLDRPVGAHFLSAGVDFARHRRDDRQVLSGALTGATDFASRERQWTLWAQDEWSLRPDWTATLGVRGEHMRITTDGQTRRHGAFAPALALRWEPSPGWVARASLSGAIRFPKLEELTAVVMRSASANTLLKPDRGGAGPCQSLAARNPRWRPAYQIARVGG